MAEHAATLERTGEPESWQTPLEEARVHEWSRRWLSEQWQEWQPRTRASATEALARFITIAVEHGAKPPEGLRVYLQSALSPNAETERDARFEKWMAKNCLTLGELDRDRIADIDCRLGLKLDDSPLAATTANRIRIVARASVQSAIDAGAVAADVWPQRSKTRARKGANRAARRRACAAESGGDGGGDRCDRHATARQQDLPSDDRSRLLRRAAAVGSRDAASPIGRVAGRGLGPA